MIEKVSKLLMFDFDWTLVRPKGNRPFPKNVDDWQWLFPSIITKIQTECKKHNYSLVIFTNQSKEWKKSVL